MGLVVAAVPDLPGHGRAPRPVPPHFAAWVHWVCERLRLATAPVHLIGYSMGGRLALAAALAEARTGRVASLTLLGAHPGLVDPYQRREREAADARRAAELEDGLMPFLDRWYRQPLFDPICQTVGLETLVLRRRHGDPATLAAALRSAGTGGMPNLRSGLPWLRIPVLTIAGTLDAKYVELGEEIANAAPRGRFAAVEGAGHALLVEAPERCARLWTEFVNEHAQPARTNHE